MKMKEFGPPGGGAPPLDPPMVLLTLFLSHPYKFLRQVSHHLRWLIFLPNQMILMLKSFLLIPQVI